MEDMMKKLLAIALALVMIFAVAACGGTDTPAPAPAPEPVAEAPTPEEPPAVGQDATAPSAPDDEGHELVLITDIGTIDDRSFNQGSWEGLAQYAQEFGKSFNYIQPAEQGDDAYLNAIDLAVQGGAKVIVTPGFLFEVPIHTAQAMYPNVHFILIDGVPHDGGYAPDIAPNTVGVTYAEEQAGFLAGYAAVYAGYTELGFMGGMAVPAVVRFGHGFVQGAEVAGEELGLGDGSITLNYHYTDVFWPLPEINTMASAWYNDGIDCIFVAGGGIVFSVIPAAEQVADKYIIGVDVDQSGLSNTIITSAMKKLSVSVYDKIADFYNGTWPGGQHVVYSAVNDGVGLPMDTSSLGGFGQAEYDALFAKLVSGAIVVDDRHDISVEDLPLTIVSLNNLG